MERHVLIGNSSLRLGGGSTPTEVLSWETFAERDFWPASLDGVQQAWIGSVRPGRTELLEDRLAARGCESRVAGRDFPLPIENLYEDPRSVGIDRLLCAIAARARFPERPVAVVDFGSAISISVVDEEGAFRGGPIAAGANTVLEGLRHRTPRLIRHTGRDPRRLLSSADASRLPTSSQAALAAGLRAQILGTVERLLEEIESALGHSRLAAIATGGEAGLFAASIPRIEAVDDDLAITGLAIAARTAAGSER